jgi:hypothetical protein
MASDSRIRHSFRYITVSALRIHLHWLGIFALATLRIFADPTNAVTFRSANLETAVRQTLAIPAPQPITEADMLQLTSLMVFNSCTDLEGLQAATNL